MVSVSNATITATATTKPAKAAELSADIVALRQRIGQLSTELKHLEVEPIKSPEIWQRISAIRDEMRGHQQEVNQKQALLDKINAEKERSRSRERATGRDVDAEQAREEKNPYARVFKTDVSALAEAVRKIDEDPLEVLTRRGPRIAMDEATAAAALIVGKDGGDPPPAEAAAAPAPVAAADDATGATPAEETDGVGEEGSDTAHEAAEKRDAEKARRRDLLERLAEIEAR